MKLRNVSAAAVIVCIFCSATTVSADKNTVSQDSVPIVNRVDGVLTEDSIQFIKFMKKTAAKNGYVTLWLTANISFDFDVENLTAQQIEDQEQNVEAIFLAALQPLVDNGLVWHPPGGPNIQGPGCIVRAKVGGVQQLAKDQRIIQIVAFAHEEM